MTYEGIEFVIRAGLGRNEWTVTIHFPDASESLARSSVVKVTGTRDEAIVTAQKRIRRLVDAAAAESACRFHRRLETSAGVIAYRHHYSTPDIIFRPPYYAHLKLRGLAMPLTATFDPGHNHYPNENVYFFMNDRDRRVRCGVSELALEVFDPQFERSKEGRLLAFNKYRPHIESVASAKYDRGQMERDGRSVLVSAADIQATFRPSLLGPQSLEFHRNRP